MGIEVTYTVAFPTDSVVNGAVELSREEAEALWQDLGKALGNGFVKPLMEDLAEMVERLRRTIDEATQPRLLHFEPSPDVPVADPNSRQETPEQAAARMQVLAELAPPQQIHRNPGSAIGNAHIGN